MKLSFHCPGCDRLRSVSIKKHVIIKAIGGAWNLKRKWDNKSHKPDTDICLSCSIAMNNLGFNTVEPFVNSRKYVEAHRQLKTLKPLPR